MVMADDQNSDFVTNAAEQKLIREPPQIRSPAKEKSLPSKSAVALPTNPLPSVKVVNNSARTAFIAGTAGIKFQPGQVRRLERELKRGDGLSKKQWVQTVKNCF